MGTEPKPGDLVRVKKGGIYLEGIVMPKTEFSSPNTIVLKLKNGYNLGIELDNAEVEVLEENVVDIGKIPSPTTTSVEGKGTLKMSFISTGGTIVSKVEYETGAVKPAITAKELIEMVPDFMDEASHIEVTELYRALSEDLTPADWERISYEAAKRIASGVDALVIAHGTDTMGLTAAALAFSLQNLPIPVMLVGAQRSSDRPSTDSVINLRACPVIAKKAPFGEIVVVMHGDTSDTYVLAHRGVKVRKMHTSKRDAFQSINDIPLAKVDFPNKEFTVLNSRYIKRSDPANFKHVGRFSDKAALLKFYPGMDCGLIDYLVDKGYRGIVLEGSGLGHIRSKCIESVRRAAEEGVLVAVTSQTLFGRINMKVYTNGRKLLEAGAISASDILPETAYVKLSWLLGNYGDRELRELKELFTTNLVNEINPFHDTRHYPRWYHG